MRVQLTCALALVCLFLVIPAFGGNDKNYRYLALGDSIAFGYDPTVMPPAPDKYTGYPETLAGAQHLLLNKKTVNASCPGQSSQTFLFGGTNDIGCQGFKDTIGLRATYSGTQAAFAVSQLQTNKHISLITLSIGGNDLLLLQRICETIPPPYGSFDQCVKGELPAVLASYGQNLTQILSDIRFQGNYDGLIVLVTYPSPSGAPLFVQAVGALNQVMAEVGALFGAKVADGFAAFLSAAAPFGGDPCAAGLFIPLGPGVCDVHPSEAGRDLLTRTIVSVLGSAKISK